MKRITLISAALLASITLAGCSTNSTSKSSNQNGSKQDVTKQEKPYFNGKTAYIPGKNAEKVEIVKTKLIPIGEKGNEDGIHPVFAIWYKFTNLSKIENDPNTAWGTVFSANQNTKEIRNNGLDAVTNLDANIDERFTKTQDDNLKKGETRENVVGYQLTNTMDPVILTAEDKLNDKYIGKTTFDIKKLAGKNATDDSSDPSINGKTDKEKQWEKNNSGEDDGFDPNNYSDPKKYDVVLPDPEN